MGKLMNCTNRTRPVGRSYPTLAFKTFSTGSGKLRLGCGLVLFGAMTASVPAFAQQKTGPGITGDDALTWHGITPYGGDDIALQYDTHTPPFTPLPPTAYGRIVRQN